MNEPTRVAARCPQCQRSTGSPFGFGGVCLRCAGERVLALDIEQIAPDTQPFEAPAELRPAVAVLPDRIGAYEIIEELGRGGMGAIYAARQIGLGRIVALKVLAARGDLAGLDLRFLREAQTVARLRHPHIVAVYDSGRADGFVYFSMEYVPGGDLGRLLRERPVTPTEAAQLLRKTAEAVAAAHAEGVLHRDIKPSNILLDGMEPKLADFGLAAQLEAGGDLTAVSGVLGTPHYLAPEALHGGSAALTVASDLYALGAVLYETLTGRPPFAGASPAELAALIDTTEPPSPRLLAPAVPRDLETICLKCLERDPARRYMNARLLAVDLSRFLAGEPILARPAGRLERLRKFSRRHRAPLALVAIAVIALVGGAAASTGLAIRARHAERNAATEAAASRAVVNFLRNDLLAQAAPTEQPDRDIKLRTVLDRAATKIDRQFQSAPLIEAAVRETLAATYNSLGEYAAARPQLERALLLRAREQGPTDPEALRAASQLADAIFNLAEYDAAQKLADKTFTRQRGILGPDHPDTLVTETVLAEVYEWQGKLPTAERLFRDALEREKRTGNTQSNDLFETMGAYSSTLLDEGKFGDAEALLRDMLAQTQSQGPNNQYRLFAMNNLAGALWSEGRFQEAAELHLHTYELTARILGPEHPDTLRSMTNLARTYAAQGRYGEAAALHRKILETRRRIFGKDYQDTLRSECYLASALREIGNYEEAESLFTTTLRKDIQILGENYPDTRQCVIEYSDLLARRGRFGEAIALLRHTIATQAGSDSDDWQFAVMRCQLGNALLSGGQLADAEKPLLDGYGDLVRLTGKIPAIYRSLQGTVASHLVELYTKAGQPEKARAWQARLTTQ